MKPVMWQVSSGGFTLKNLHECTDEFFGAKKVEFDWDEKEWGITFCWEESRYRLVESGWMGLDLKKEYYTSIRTETIFLKPGQRLENIKDLARAMRQTFPETGYPK